VIYMSSATEHTDGTYVIFRLGAEEYGLEIGKVQSIVHFDQPTPVPKSDESIMGVLNLRGKVIPIVDVARRLGRERFRPGSGSRIIVVEGDAGLMGLAVDSANEVTEIRGDQIQAAPAAVLGAEGLEVFDGVANRDGALVILMNLDRAVPRVEYVHLGETVALEGEFDVQDRSRS